MCSLEIYLKNKIKKLQVNFQEELKASFKQLNQL